MSTWALLGLLVVVLVAVGIAAFLRWGRGRDDDPTSHDDEARPRTVADLVERRARGLSGDGPAARPEAPSAGSAVAQSGGADPGGPGSSGSGSSRSADVGSTGAASGADTGGAPADGAETRGSVASSADTSSADTGGAHTGSAGVARSPEGVTAGQPGPTEQPGSSVLPADPGPVHRDASRPELGTLGATVSSAPDITDAAADTAEDGASDPTSEVGSAEPRITPDVSAGPVGPPWSRGFKDGKPVEPVDPPTAPTRRVPSPAPISRRRPLEQQPRTEPDGPGPDSSAPDISTPATRPGTPTAGGLASIAAFRAARDERTGPGSRAPERSAPAPDGPDTDTDPDTDTGLATEPDAGQDPNLPVPEVEVDAVAASRAPVATAVDEEPIDFGRGVQVDATAGTVAERTDAVEPDPDTVQVVGPASDLDEAGTAAHGDAVRDAAAQGGAAQDDAVPDAAAQGEAVSVADVVPTGAGAEPAPERSGAGPARGNDSTEPVADPPVVVPARAEQRSPVDPDLVKRVTAVPAERPALRGPATPDTEREFREARDRIAGQSSWSGRVPEQASASERSVTTEARVASIGLAATGPREAGDTPEPPPRPAPRVLRSTRPVADRPEPPPAAEPAPPPVTPAPEPEVSPTVHTVSAANTANTSPAPAGEEDEDVALAVRRPGPAPDVVVPGTAPQDVEVRALGPDDGALGGVSVVLRDRAGRTAGSAVTGADGIARIPAPGAGEFAVVARLDGHRPGVAAVSVADSAVAVTVRLHRSATVHGTVLAGVGPAAGVPVALEQDGVPVAETRTGPDGTFRLTDLDAGRYRLVAGTGADAPGTDVEVPAGGDVEQDVTAS
ncbi:hypothetical protein [Pseudonocardia sp. NPDC049635]|uniref:hypothetical protein n=1 Tax=Pseudonocardia sp. NPDC049635 TaxID=3155506 RepID=UPI0033D5B06C